MSEDYICLVKEDDEKRLTCIHIKTNTELSFAEDQSMTFENPIEKLACGLEHVQNEHLKC